MKVPQGFIAVFYLFITSTQSHADLIVDTVGTAVTIDFQGFNGGGFEPNGVAGSLINSNGTLNSDTIIASFEDTLNFGGTDTGGAHARGISNGDETSGGIYAFDTGTDGGDVTGNSNGSIGLGFQPSDTSFTPGEILLRVRNDTGSSVPIWAVKYDIFNLNNEGRASTFDFAYSTNGTDFTEVSTANFTSPTTADAGGPPFVWTQTQQSVTFSANVADAGHLFLRWNSSDAGGSGSRDEFALDNVSVTGTPEPSTFILVGMAALAFGGFSFLRHRKNQYGHLMAAVANSK